MVAAVTGWQRAQIKVFGDRLHTEVPTSLPDLEQTVRVPTESGTVKLVVHSRIPSRFVHNFRP